MYSHALATYQKSLLVFWEKTSKTMKAVADSFKGYQYYEFTVIKNLAEPSRLLAEMNSKSSTEKDDSLFDVNERKNNQKERQTPSNDNNQKEITDITEPVNALIDISDDQLDSQLLELEQLTTIDRNTSTSANTKAASNNAESLVEVSNASAEYDKIFSEFLSPTSSGNTTNDLLEANDNNSFDAHWTAAFGNNSNQQQVSTGQADSTTPNNTNSFLPSTLLSELLTSMNKGNKPASIQPLSNAKPKPTATSKSAEKSNWLNLFAELDPLQNPDAIGKTAGDEADRSC